MTNEPKDHPTPVTSLVAALEWAQREPIENQLTEIRFGQRSPQTVGPDRHYWYAQLTREVSNNLSGVLPGKDTPHRRVERITGEWAAYYYPGVAAYQPEEGL